MDELMDVEEEEKIVDFEKAERTRGQEITERYLEQLFKQSEEDREWYSPQSIHVGDLLPECERQVVLSKLYPRGANVPSMMYMEDGKSKHRIELGDKHELRVEWAGIRASVDDYDSIKGIVIEKKTTMSLKVPLPRKVHVLQLQYYAAMLQEMDMR
jgi:hypothetical protein